MTAPVPDVARMWQAHLDRWFPPLLRGAEVGHIDVVLLDSYTAGYVSTWLGNGGHLDPEKSRILANCVANLDTVIAVFTDGEELHYLRTDRASSERSFIDRSLCR